MGTTHSTMCGNIPTHRVSERTVNVMEFSGVHLKLLFTTPCTIEIADQKLLHSFLASPHTPVNLLVTVLCGPDGVIVQFPNCQWINCSADAVCSDAQWLVGVSPTDPHTHMADFYWGLLDAEGDKLKKGIHTLYLK